MIGNLKTAVLMAVAMFISGAASALLSAQFIEGVFSNIGFVTVTLSLLTAIGIFLFARDLLAAPEAGDEDRHHDWPSASTPE